MNALLTDLKQSLRVFRKSPGFAATVIAVLALGVGANTAIFSVIHAVLMNPFPYPDSDRILFIGSSRNGEQGMMPVTYPDYVDWRSQAGRFDELAFATNRSFILTQVESPAAIGGASISASAWPMLGMQPVLGRTFTDEEDRPGANPVCVISHSLWQGRFGGDPNIVGRTLTLDGRPATVVGVMSPRFKFWGADIWMPVGLEADSEIMRSRVIRMNSWVVGKMKAGVTRDEARTELDLIAARIAKQHPDSNNGIGVNLRLLSDSVTGPVREPLIMLLASVGFVLLIACANVANLLLARSATRQREFAIRAALGAGRGRLVSQTLLEILPLAAAGAAAGITMGAWALDTLLTLLPEQAIPSEANISVNIPVMLFSLGVCIATMLLFALFPAFETSRIQLNDVLHEGGRGTAGPRAGRARAALIVAEVSLALVLLVGAGLLIRSFGKLQSVDPGFNTKNLVLMSVNLPEDRYKSGIQATQFFRDLIEQIRRIPGVSAAAVSNNAPFVGGSDIPLVTPDRTYTEMNELSSVQFSVLQGDYFRALGLRLSRGRILGDDDRAGGEPVIILNEAAVKEFIPEGDPLGQRVMLGLPANLITPGLLPPGLDKFEWARVVGVVENARHFGLQNDAPPAAYIPVEQSWNTPIVRNQMIVLVRTEADPLQVVPSLRTAVTSIDPDQPIGRIGTMESVILDSLQQSRFTTVLLGIFAGVACSLAVVGIYGVVAWNVAQRTRELGIRAALGATRADLLRLVVGQGMRVVLLGIAIGLAGSLALSTTLKNLLFQTSAFDPWTFAAVGTLLAAVALLACLLPALRANRITPLEALRAD